MQTIDDALSRDNSFTESKLDTCILVNTDSDETYAIDLGEDEQKAIYDALDEQCQKELGVGCDQLLEDAKAEM